MEDLVVDVLWAWFLTRYDMRVPIVTDAATSEVYFIGEAINSFKRSPAVHHCEFFSWNNEDNSLCTFVQYHEDLSTVGAKTLLC